MTTLGDHAAGRQPIVIAWPRRPTSAARSRLNVTCVDGYAAGTSAGLPDRRRRHRHRLFSNGQKLALGQVALANFNNPPGLEKAGNSAYRATTNSGNRRRSTPPGAGGVGTLLAGSLEMSNVDLASEFTNLIIAQRGFQANSRVITTSDQMLQDLVDIKRYARSPSARTPYPSGPPGARGCSTCRRRRRQSSVRRCDPVGPPATDGSPPSPPRTDSDHPHPPGRAAAGRQPRPHRAGRAHARHGDHHGRRPQAPGHRVDLRRSSPPSAAGGPPSRRGLRAHALPGRGRRGRRRSGSDRATASERSPRTTSPRTASSAPRSHGCCACLPQPGRRLTRGSGSDRRPRPRRSSPSSAPRSSKAAAPPPSSWSRRSS